MKYLLLGLSVLIISGCDENPKVRLSDVYCDIHDKGWIFRRGGAHGDDWTAQRYPELDSMCSGSSLLKHACVGDKQPKWCEQLKE